jgi:dCTP deaminase
MNQLSAQSIRKLCEYEDMPLIYPFIERTVINGKSGGLGPASYDLRIKADLVLGPSPIYRFNKMLRACQYTEVMMQEYKEALTDADFYPNHALAVSIEKFCFPNYVAGRLADKSTYARMFVSCFNTVFDPGFVGPATLELVNHGPNIIEIKAGDPICQMVFSWLDRPTEMPYMGKYQNQPHEPIGPIHEYNEPTSPGIGLED